MTERRAPMRALPLRVFALVGALAAAGQAGAADAAGATDTTGNCDALRAQIDAKIRTSGVQRFTLAIVDAQAKAVGRVVGTCDLGSRKITYLQEAAAGGRASVVRPRDEPLVTECKDGRVTVGGDCRK